MTSYSILKPVEWYKYYVVIQFYWIEINTGKDNIMLMDDDIRGDREI